MLADATGAGRQRGGGGGVAAVKKHRHPSAARRSAALRLITRSRSDGSDTLPRPNARPCSLLSPGAGAHRAAALAAPPPGQPRDAAARHRHRRRRPAAAGDTRSTAVGAAAARRLPGRLLQRAACEGAPGFHHSRCGSTAGAGGSLHPRPVGRNPGARRGCRRGRAHPSPSGKQRAAARLGRVRTACSLVQACWAGGPCRRRRVPRAPHALPKASAGAPPPRPLLSTAATTASVLGPRPADDSVVCLCRTLRNCSGPPLQARGVRDVLAVDVSPAMLAALQRRAGQPSSLGNDACVRTWLGDVADLPGYQARWGWAARGTVEAVGGPEGNTTGGAAALAGTAHGAWRMPHPGLCRRVAWPAALPQGPFDVAIFNAVFGNLLDAHATLASTCFVLRPGRRALGCCRRRRRGRTPRAQSVGRCWAPRHVPKSATSCIFLCQTSHPPPPRSPRPASPHFPLRPAGPCLRHCGGHVASAPPCGAPGTSASAPSACPPPRGLPCFPAGAPPPFRLAPCSYVVISHPLGRPWHESLRAKQPQLVPNELPQASARCVRFGWPHPPALPSCPPSSAAGVRVCATDACAEGFHHPQLHPCDLPQVPLGWSCGLHVTLQHTHTHVPAPPMPPSCRLPSAHPGAAGSPGALDPRPAAAAGQPGRRARLLHGAAAGKLLLGRAPGQARRPAPRTRSWRLAAAAGPAAARPPASSPPAALFPSGPAQCWLRVALSVAWHAHTRRYQRAMRTPLRRCGWLAT